MSDEEFEANVLGYLREILGALTSIDSLLTELVDAATKPSVRRGPIEDEDE